MFNCIMWAIKHELPYIFDIGLDIALKILQVFTFIAEPESRTRNRQPVLQAVLHEPDVRRAVRAHRLLPQKRLQGTVPHSANTLSGSR